MARITRTCSAALALALLGLAAPAQADRGEAGLGAYVRARAADAGGDAVAAAAGYAAALEAQGDDPVVALRAYRKALEAGDIALATRALAVLDHADVTPPDGALLHYALAVRGGDPAGAEAALRALTPTALGFLAPPLRAWAGIRGADPLAAVARMPEKGPGRRYTGEQRALLLIATGRAAEGLAALQLARGGDGGDPDLTIAAAQFLAATGHREEALALLDPRRPLFAAMRAHLGEGKPDAATGAARLIVRLSSDLADNPPLPLAITLGRTALLLEPGNDHARLLLADALARAGEPAAGLRELDRLAPASPYAGEAGLTRIAILTRAADADGALAAARAGGDADPQLLGDLLLAAGRFGEAADAYRLAIRAAGEDVPWTLTYRRASALDRAGRWSEALPLLERAAALAPDEPDVLNALGYGLVERGQKRAEAERLLERAARLSPDSGAIADSLGQARFRRGDTAGALPLLEKAAEAEPADATVHEHLGDAYWKLGRRYEARYAWSAAALLAEAPARQRLAAKIAGR